MNKLFLVDQSSENAGSILIVASTTEEAIKIYQDAWVFKCTEEEICIKYLGTAHSTLEKGVVHKESGRIHPVFKKKVKPYKERFPTYNSSPPLLAFNSGDTLRKWEQAIADALFEIPSHVTILVEEEENKVRWMGYAPIQSYSAFILCLFEVMKDQHRQDIREGTRRMTIKEWITLLTELKEYIDEQLRMVKDRK